MSDRNQGETQGLQGDEEPLASPSFAPDGRDRFYCPYPGDLAGLPLPIGPEVPPAKPRPWPYATMQGANGALQSCGG